MMKKLAYFVVGLAMLVGGAFAANNLTFSFGTTWVPAGPALFMGNDFQILTNAVNALRNQNDGTTNGVYKGAFNGTVGATTPSTGVFTTISASGGFTPTGGVAPAGGFTVSPRNIATCNQAAQTSAAGNDSTPAATEVYISEVYVPSNMSVTGVAYMNGSVASGNVKMGLANSAGAVVATSASTAVVGTEAYQLVSFTAPYAAVGPATYYVLQFFDNATDRYEALPFGTCGASKQTGQTYATGFTTITPPTTFTANLGPVANLF